MSRVMTFARIGAVALIVAAASLVTASPAAASVLGHQIVTAATAADSTSPKDVVVSCPAGKLLVGAYYALDGDVENVVVDRLVPVLGTLQVTAQETAAGTKGNWWLRGSAVCVSASQPGVEVVRMGSAIDSGNKTMTAGCPSGKSAIGVGFSVSNGSGRVLVSSAMPDGQGSVTVTAVEIGAGTPQGWHLMAYAICSFHMSGLAPVDVQTFSTSEDKGANAQCGGPGKVMLGTGWAVDGRNPGTVSAPFLIPERSSSSVAAQEIGAGDPLPWSLRVRAMCAFPN